MGSGRKAAVVARTSYVKVSVFSSESYIPIGAAHRREAAGGGPDGEVWMTIGLYFKDMAAGGSQKR